VKAHLHVAVTMTAERGVLLFFGSVARVEEEKMGFYYTVVELRGREPTKGSLPGW
jgi:hypothetical protein